MTALRQLSGIYVAAAGAYTLAMVMSAHPLWVRNTETAAATVRAGGITAAVALNTHVICPGGVFLAHESVAFGHFVGQEIRMAMNRAAPSHSAPAHVAARPLPVPHRVAAAPPPFVAAPVVPEPPSVPREVPHETAPSVAALPPLRGSEQAPKLASVPRPQLSLAPPVPPAAPDVTASLPGTVPSAATGNPADIVRVTERLRDSLSREIFENFELFLYVSKADAGPWAQHMYVFKKQPSGDLALLYNWPVSTGRERIEFNPEGRRVQTDTPPGYYELDPNRSYARYRSGEWGQSMPYAMFFNWVRNGDETGLAIHAASGDDVAKIGQRASAGCIHLSEDNARTLFTMIRAQYRGLAPRFAIDRRTGTMSNQGILLHDAGGQVKMAEGYKVLVFIEDYGGENVVAALF